MKMVEHFENQVDNLINDINIPLSEKSVKVKKSATELKRGTVLGIVKATGLAVPVDSSKTDGSEVADCILAIDITPETDVFVPAYSSGQFNRQALIFGGSDTADKHETKLRELGIFLKDNVK